VRGRVRQRHKCVTRPSVATFAATIAPNVTRGNEQREHATLPSAQFAVTDARDVDTGRVTSTPPAPALVRPAPTRPLGLRVARRRVPRSQVPCRSYGAAP